LHQWIGKCFRLVILGYCTGTVFATLYVQGIAGGNVLNQRF